MELMNSDVARAIGYQISPEAESMSTRIVEVYSDILMKLATKELAAIELTIKQTKLECLTRLIEDSSEGPTKKELLEEFHKLL